MNRENMNSASQGPNATMRASLLKARSLFLLVSEQPPEVDMKKVSLVSSSHS